MAAKMEVCVDVFKTNVKKKSDAEVIVQLLANYFPNHEINFDLEDRDKSCVLQVQKITSFLLKMP